MKATEINIEVLSSKIQALETKEVMTLVSDIAKATKKKTLKSGTQSFGEFCKTIASALTKQTTKILIQKHNLI